jgi:hypothetical protein
MNYSKVESERFFMNIFREKINDIDIKSIQKEILKKKIDISIIRIPTDKTDCAIKLDIIGFPYIMADTLVYYMCDIEKYIPKKLRNVDLQFEICTENKINILSELIDKIFYNYSSHYKSNYFFDKKLVIEGYKEWACNFIGLADKIVFLVKKRNNIIGFATCSWNELEKTCEGVLYGVLPELSGGGIYTDIIRFTQDYYKSKGIIKMLVSTQIQNVAVQKVWSKEGFFLFESFNTIHINSLLSFSKINVLKEEITITEELINNYGALSEDYNPIHYSDEVAQSMGFEKRIAHGLISSAIISRFLGTKFPGEGTVFLNYKYLFYKPLYINNRYSVVFSFPDYVENFKTLYIVVKILDENDEVCLLSYNSIIKK